MKFVIVLLAVVATTYAQFAQPQFQQQQFQQQPFQQQQFGVNVAKAPVPFVRHSEIRDDHGQYSLGYETGDGIGVAEQGVLKPNSEGQYVLVKQGTYRYTSPDGTPITLNYVADENGFQPSGTHIPKQVLPENPTN